MTKQDEEDKTMEEILESIRRYVTEDQNSSPPKTPFLPREEEPRDDISFLRSQDSSAPQEHHRSYRETDSSPFPFKEDRLSIPSFHEEKYDHIKESSVSSAYSSPEKNVSVSGIEETPLISEKTLSSMATKFSQLEDIKIKSTQQKQETSGVTVDTFIKNLARPMIKEWLDKNLPQIVEAMVEKEIQRIRNSPTN